MDDLEGRHGTVRIGVILIAASMMMASLALLAPLDRAVLPWLIPVFLLGLTGLGLLRSAPAARVLTGLLLLACVVIGPISTVRMIAASAQLVDGGAAWSLAIANALATTVLVVWLCLRGIQQLLGRAPRASLVTARIAGGALAVIAVNHLWLAATGIAWDGAFSITISVAGTSLLGFPGWPLWHVGALVLGLALLVGPRRILAHVATALMLLLVALALLVVVATIRIGALEIALVSLGVLLLPLYLAWWLRAELRLR